ncbi:MAG: hypothetical protein KGM43_16215 [Planctomycetota bacterium]|nr:hypothetical protein [Planctomycetota bacterium]
MSATPRLATTAPPRAFLGRVRSRLSLILVLAAAGLVQTGCSSPCTSCGSGSGLLSRVRERVFTRRVFRPVPAAGCCGDSVGAVPVETAPTVVTPGTTVVPPADANPDIEAIPRSKSVPPDGVKSSSSANKPTSYEASRPARDQSAREVAPGSNNNSARILIPNNSTAQTPAGGARSSLNVLDNLPPLELPGATDKPARTRGDDASPPATAASEIPAKPAPKPDNSAAKAPATDKPAPNNQAAASPARDPFDAAPVPVPPPNEPEPASPKVAPTAENAPARVLEGLRVAPGIRRFVTLAPAVSGGSLPTPSGLDWLAETGCKTIIDLREPREVSPSYLAEVTNRGMTYVVIPITSQSLDSDHFARFQAELAHSAGRPLYFCDTDGSRAGAMWYVYRVAVDHLDATAAAREAAALGLSDTGLLAVARDFADRRKQLATPDSAAASKKAVAPKTVPPQINKPAASNSSARSLAAR